MTTKFKNQLSIIFTIIAMILTFFANFNFIKSKATNLKTIEEGVLTVGTNATFHPFEYKNESNEIVGFDIDLINLIATELKLKVKIVDMPFDGLLKALGTKLDLVIAGLTKTEEREKMVNFSQSYFQGKQTILTKKDREIKNEQDLKGLTIATQIGTTANDFIKNLKEKIQNITTKDYDEYDIMVEDILSGRVDMVMLDEIAALNQLKKHPNQLKMTNGSVLNCPIEDCCIATAKDNTKLQQSVDNALSKIKNTQTYKNLLSKHMNITTQNTKTDENNGLKDQFYASFLEKGRWKLYLKGLLITMIISIFAAILGFFLGGLLFILKTIKNKKDKPSIISKLANLYISVIRGTPVLVQLLIMWLIILKNVKNGVFVAILSFGLNSAAYVAEIIRSGVNGVDIGQTQASYSLGFNKVQTLCYFVLPQGLKNSIPSLCNEFISLIKETAVVGYVALNDLTRAAFSISAASYQTFMPLFVTALIYFIVTKLSSIILEFVSKKLELKMKK